MSAPAPDTRLARSLGLADAVVIGLGAMIGAGVFSAIGPAARAAGSGLLLGLAAAAFVAWCNAVSSAQLAAVHPRSGGAYVYGRERLGALWGFLAGWGFVFGKIASCAAMALTFGAHVLPSHPHFAAAAAALVFTFVNLLGVKKTARATLVILAVVVASLGTAVVALLAGGTVETTRLLLPENLGPHGILQSAGFLFFAFAGYARIATLGEEVVEPERTIPRAIPIALAIALAIYATVAIAALLASDPGLLARSDAPLATAIEHGDVAFTAPFVRAGAAVACLGVLLSLLAGISRTAFAMASEGDLPRILAEVHPATRIPHLAQLAVGAAVLLLVLLTDVRGAIGFSSFTVLGYYAVANAAALRLAPAERRWPRAFSAAGLAGCALVAVSLPIESVAAGVAVFAAAGVAWLLRRVPPA